MSYIVRVVGYNVYWTGNTEPGKCWSTDIQESQRFDSKEKAEVIVNSGMNMEAIEYDFASSDIQKEIPDWDEIDRKLSELESKKNKEVVELNDFETVSNEIHDVNVEVIN